MKSIIQLLLCTFLLPGILSAQTVTTVAANASIDDALLFDTAGNLYGSNYEGATIFKMTPNGTVSTFANGFTTPNGLAFDQAGFLYMADNVGNRIYKIATDGSPTSFVPNIFNPSGLIFEHDSDTLIATSYSGNKLMKIAPDGSVTDFVTSGMNGPVGLAYDDNHNLYVAEFGAANASGGRKIFKITPDGVVTLHAQLSSGGSIGFIAYCKGYLYATLIYSHKIYRIDLAGNKALWLGSTAGNADGEAAVAKFNGPNGIIANASQDTLYVSDFNSKSVRRITNLGGASALLEKDLNFQFSLSPNPSSSQLELAFELPKNMAVEAWLIDSQGNSVQHLLQKTDLQAGQHRFSATLAELPPGHYFCQISLDDKFEFVKKLVLVR